jgi:lipopolysaccharide export system protein LptA
MSPSRRASLALWAVAFALLPLAHAWGQGAASPEQEAAPAAAPVTPAAPPAASGTSGSFGAFSKNSGQPIDIESDVLLVHDQQKYATFKGNVKAVQGTTTLRSNELDVHYSGAGADSLTGGAPKSAAPGATTQAAPAPPPADAGAKPAAGVALGEGGNQITKIEGRGNVIITTEQDQTTTSDWVLYDVPAQLMTVGGNVVLTQGKNVLKGTRLVIDLKTGESRFDNTGNTTGGKIQAIFMPKQDAPAKDGKSGNGQAGKDASGTNKPDAKPDTGEAAKDGAAAEVAPPEPLFPGLPQ